MWEITVIFVCCVAAQVTSHEIDVKCREMNGFPQDSSVACPSALAELKVELVMVEETGMLNISWAINIDASIPYLNGTRIGISGDSSYLCEYIPPLKETRLTDQTWFHHLFAASHGFNVIEAANLPLPPLKSNYPNKSAIIMITEKQLQKRRTTAPPEVTTAAVSTEPPPSEVADQEGPSGVVVVCILGGVVSLLVLLSSCYAISRCCGSSNMPFLGFKKLPETHEAMIPVLVVYPAENSAFQRAVVELAEFLQWHGGCRVAIDMWQQGKIAELGPLRWLAEQAKAADHVLIVCPQPSSQPSHSPPSLSAPEPSIPAAAHDLYPLILNMVASHAKNASELAKFRVVQLGEQRNKKPCTLPAELRACKTFCLMKDLNKLCKSLRAQRRDDKETLALMLKPGVSHTEKNTVKLMEAIRMLREHQSSISRESALASIV
ncbi:uncharacterized protein LOC124999001 isoform X2 [Mugil cephalus]|uniref:uncharacterized protein LOC124999001 isoform X2 n=1 Tax=Mugil cephalus TaxID=48193 RepID=UPI001FB5DC41|nr:uncharacterized protein LOC124999001 isoform X2 [Mugil cephalus]